MRLQAIVRGASFSVKRIELLCGKRIRCTWRSACFHLPDKVQFGGVAASSHLVNPPYSVIVRRVVQPPNNGLHSILRCAVGNQDS